MSGPAPTWPFDLWRAAQPNLSARLVSLTGDVQATAIPLFNGPRALVLEAVLQTSALAPHLDPITGQCIDMDGRLNVLESWSTVTTTALNLASTQAAAAASGLVTLASRVTAAELAATTLTSRLGSDEATTTALTSRVAADEATLTALAARVALLEGLPRLRYAKTLTTPASGVLTVTLPAANLELTVLPRTPGLLWSVTTSGTSATITFQKLNTGGLGITLATLLSISILASGDVGPVVFDLLATDPIP